MGPLVLNILHPGAFQGSFSNRGTLLPCWSHSCLEAEDRLRAGNICPLHFIGSTCPALGLLQPRCFPCSFSKGTLPLCLSQAVPPPQPGDTDTALSKVSACLAFVQGVSFAELARIPPLCCNLSWKWHLDDGTSAFPDRAVLQA